MLPGTTIGRYEILRLLAAGGMGEVYLARQHSTVPGFATLVVIKLLIRSLSTNPAFVQMFLEEARIVGRLRHKNVVQVYDVARHEDQYYMVMEYIPGQNLRELLGDVTILDRPLFAPRLGAEVFADLAGALAAAHAEHMVHRDISPNNLMIGDEGVAKLIDFGVARALGTTSLTKPGTLKGKFSYMAPEYVRSQAYDHRIDLFSLGVVMWETFARRRLFRGPSAAEQIHQLIEAPIPSLDEVVPGFPRDLAVIVAAALERDPMRRISSAMLLADSLSEIARALPVGPDPTLRKWLESRIPERLHERHRTDQALATLPAGSPVPDFGIAFPFAGNIPESYRDELALEPPAPEPPAVESPPPPPTRAQGPARRSRVAPVLLGFLAGVVALGAAAALLLRAAPPERKPPPPENEIISAAEAHRELGLKALASGDRDKARYELAEALRLGGGDDLAGLLALTMTPAAQADAGAEPPERAAQAAHASDEPAPAQATTSTAPEPAPAAPRAPLDEEPGRATSARATRRGGTAAPSGERPPGVPEPAPRASEPVDAAPVAPSPPPQPAPVAAPIAAPIAVAATRPAPALVEPTPPAPTPRVTSDGSPAAGAKVVQACNACHASSGARAVQGRRYVKAQWERFFASGQHDRYLRLGDRMTAGQLQAARAFLRANAADSAENQGAGVQE